MLQELSLTRDMKHHDVVRAYRLGNQMLSIIRSAEPINPREWDNLGIMVCFHRRYNLGDKHGYSSPRDFLKNLAAELGMCPVEVEDATLDNLLGHIRDNAVILPLYLYDHSGITMNTTGFSCPWDSGQVGWIYVTDERVRKEYGTLTAETVEQARQVLLGEVKVYDQYLRGDICGFVLKDTDGNHLDSCWGFYGDNPLQNGMVDYLPAEWRESLRANGG